MQFPRAQRRAPKKKARSKSRSNGRAKSTAAGTNSKAVRSDRSLDEQVLWLLTFALFAFGAVMVYSASSGNAALRVDGDPAGYLKRYLLIGGAGLIAMRIIAQLDLNIVRKWTPRVLAISIVLLIAVIFIGQEINGASRWIGVGLFSFQPSEVAKLALVLYAALLIAQDPTRVQDMKRMAKPLFWVVGGIALLIMAQPDMGTDLVIIATMFVLLLAAGAKPGDLMKICGVLVVLALIAGVVEPYRMARLTAFLNPDGDLAGAGYQSAQARIAIGSGGLFGVGIGESVQKIHYMPEAHTDMILAVIGEELGLAGIFMLVGLYGSVIFFGLRAAKNSRDIYARMLALGITSMLACQALLNFFAVMGMAPLTGVPMPFISYGGCNLIIMLSAMGLLVNVASGRHQARVRVIEGGAQGRSRARNQPQERVAAAGGMSSPRGFGSQNESRNRSRGNSRARRSGPGRR